MVASQQREREPKQYGVTTFRPSEPTRARRRDMIRRAAHPMPPHGAPTAASARTVIKRTTARRLSAKVSFGKLPHLLAIFFCFLSQTLAFRVSLFRHDRTTATV
jgi:hypothetical protein